MAVFTYTAEYEVTGKEKPMITSVNFGDGYEQRQAFGLNTLKKSFPLTFSYRSDAEATAIIEFFRARNGVESFTWTAPFESTPALWVCREWDRQIKRAGLSTVTATFEKVFDPS